MVLVQTFCAFCTTIVYLLNKILKIEIELAFWLALRGRPFAGFEFWPLIGFKNPLAFDWLWKPIGLLIGNERKAFAGFEFWPLISFKNPLAFYQIWNPWVGKVLSLRLASHVAWPDAPECTNIVYDVPFVWYFPNILSGIFWCLVLYFHNI